MSEAVQDDMVTIKVDGQSLKAKKGSMLIEVTDAAGITVPRFCYHPKLSVAANCRMCLVEVEKAPKPLPACATPVSDGMNVMTKSAVAVDAQQGTMEFLLINHPLDCPVCDQGGECELQDLSLGYGGSESRYAEEKRAVPEKDIGPLVATEMTRCIHCTRCVRFGDEIAGFREMGAVNRGEHVEIGTYVEKALESELSGNIIDICPVGALTAKPSRFVGRSWEYAQHPSISPHDGVGSNLDIHTLRNDIVRVVSRTNEAINETWISDRDRFSYEGLLSDERALHPWTKNDGNVEWNDALETMRLSLKEAISTHGADAVSVMLSPNTTQEEAFILSQICRHLGVTNVDYRLRQKDLTAVDKGYMPWLGQSIEEVAENDAILLLGSNVRYDQPMIGHRIKQAADNGAEVFSLGSQEFDFKFECQSHAAHSGHLKAHMAQLAVEASKDSGNDLPEAIKDAAKYVNDDFDAASIITTLSDAKVSSVFVGLESIESADYHFIHECAVLISNATNSDLGHLTEGANATGLHMLGLNSAEDSDLTNKKAFILWGVEPGHDHYLGAELVDILHNANFVLSVSAFHNDYIESYSDVILPIASFGEASGTYVNLAGASQSFRAAQAPREQARPGWRLARVIGTLLNVSNIGYDDINEVRDDIDKAIARVQPTKPKLSSVKTNADGQDSAGAVTLVGNVGIYQTDGLVRRATSLQASPLANIDIARVSPSVAEKYDISFGDIIEFTSDNHSAEFMVDIDERVADGACAIQYGTSLSALLSGATQVDLKVVQKVEKVA